MIFWDLSCWCIEGVRDVQQTSGEGAVTGLRRHELVNDRHDFVTALLPVLLL